MIPRGIVHLNGHLTPAARARISIFDRGFLYSDGLFETIRAYRGKPFALDDHLARLEVSAGLLGIPLPKIPWERRIAALLRANRLLHRDAWVRFTVTRGVAAPGLLPPAKVVPTVAILAGPIAPQVQRLQRVGARAVLLPFGLAGFLCEHKTIDYLPAVVGKTMAARHRAFEGLYVNGKNQVTEGTTTNIFALQGNRLITPPAKAILPGVTRGHLISLVHHAGVRLEERPIPTRDLANMDEVLLTSSLIEVMPLVRIDEQPVGCGRVGPVTRSIQGLYRQFVAEHLSNDRF